MALDINRIHFTSYCWSLGTTSFRTEKFNYMIEEQLKLIKEFFSLDENKELKWERNRKLQTRYYDYLKSNGFIKGDAARKDKDARQKTSGLVDLGLIDNNRRLTPVGDKLVDIAIKHNYKTKNSNYFGIDNDSYIYLLQLLKYTTEDNIRPFVVLLKVLNELDYITETEFKYILPLVINVEVAKAVVDNIIKIRAGYSTVDELIINLIWKMDNYQAAFEYFIQNEPNEEMFVLINMNRKSPEKYEPPYAKLYEKLIEVYVDGKEESIIKLYDAINNLYGKAKGYWKKMIFSPATRKKILKNPKVYLKPNKLSSLNEEYEIKKYIFEKIHLFKWKSTLDDYFDLNRRYFKLSDIVMFQDGKVSLSLLAKEYFKYCVDGFFEDSFKQPLSFNEIVSIESILGKNTPDMNSVYSNIATHFGKKYIDPDDIQSYVDNERLDKFNALIDEKFTDEKLLYCIDLFEERKDEKLNEYITDNADAPTMFEYILGIIWYKLSGRKGNILEFMNLSLDADLLPKTHAGGGEADIVYRYEETSDYPAHELLLEATLADNSTQRRMEFEPVSRHLMRNLMETGNLNNYATLVSTNIHPSVLSDFRSRATTDQTLDAITYFDGIKLLALDTQVIKNFISNSFKYKDIYNLLDNAHHSSISLRDGWYQKEIIEKTIK